MTWQEEQAAIRAKLTGTLEAVAPLLSGEWSVETPHDHGAQLVSADGVTVWARVETYGAKSGRLTLSAGVPDGYEYSAGDTHGLDRPEITVSPDRDPVALARDIDRRLIPAAVDYWQAVSDRIARRHAALSARESLAGELAGVMGTTAREWRGDWSAPVPDALSGRGAGEVNVYGEMTADYAGESVRLELRGLSPEMARELAAVIAGWTR